ncbi:hypothetical protein ABK040_007165 [Willaertia magna]
MDAQEYFDQTGVTTYLKDAITLILENRPEDPLEFLSEYFNNVVKGSNSLTRSYRYIKLAKRNQEAFFDNLVAAYNSFSNKNSPEDIGLNGSEFVKLVKLVCNDFPPEILKKVVDVLNKGNSNTLLSFQEFAAGINACLLYEEYLKIVEELFGQLDSGTGFVEINSIVEMLDLVLKDNHIVPQPSPTKIQRCIDSFRKISNDGKVTYKEFILSLFQLTSPFD